MVAAAGWRGWVGRREVEIAAALERRAVGRATGGGGRPTRPSGGRCRWPWPRDSSPSGSTPTSRIRRGRVDSRVAADAARRCTVCAPRSPHGCPRSPRPTRGYARVEVFVGPPGRRQDDHHRQDCRAGARPRRPPPRAGRGRRLPRRRRRAAAHLRRDPRRAVLRRPHAARARRGADGPRAAPMLVDTAGRSPSDPARASCSACVGRAARRAHASGVSRRHAGRAARRIFDAYAEARPSRVVLTKLDEDGVAVAARRRASRTAAANLLSRNRSAGPRRLEPRHGRSPGRVGARRPAPFPEHPHDPRPSRPQPWHRHRHHQRQGRRRQDERRHQPRVRAGALGIKVGILDADFGLGNIDVMLGLTPQ